MFIFSYFPLDFGENENPQFALAEKLYQQGEQFSLAAFATSTHPSLALDILFKLTRRQVYDFGRAREALAFWRRLPEGKKLWLWNNDNRWWGYVTLILLAHLQSGDPAEASQFAQSLLDDPATPRTALPGLLVPYYEALIRLGRAGEALKAFEWIVTENPTQSGCAPAYYWLALNAHRRGDTPSTIRWSEHLLLGNVHTGITSEQWLLEAKARLLMNGLDPKKVSRQAVNFNNAYLGTALDEIQNDLRLL